jgi:hypothetical protein
MRGWQTQPRKMVEYEHTYKETSQAVGCRSLGCRLQFGGAGKKGPSRNLAANFKHTAFSAPTQGA